jgi:hypothetical protein
MLHVVMLSVIMLLVVMLHVVMLSVIMLNVIMLSIVAPKRTSLPLTHIQTHTHTCTVDKIVVDEMLIDQKSGIKSLKTIEYKNLTLISLYWHFIFNNSAILLGTAAI